MRTHPTVFVGWLRPYHQYKASSDSELHRNGPRLPPKHYDPELKLDSLGIKSNSHEQDDPIFPQEKKSFDELSPARFEETDASFRSQVDQLRPAHDSSIGHERRHQQSSPICDDDISHQRYFPQMDKGLIQISTLIRVRPTKRTRSFLPFHIL